VMRWSAQARLLVKIDNSSGKNRWLLFTGLDIFFVPN
jgi:hypothetical protein